jgi:hypothetical protein
MSRDYKRHGTTGLFAAMNVATGEVVYDTTRSHKVTDVLAFFKLLDLHMPRHLEVDVVLHNLSAHRVESIATWLNLVEGQFSLLTERRLRRGVFSSVDDLVTAIETWAEHSTNDPKSFAWKKPTHEIVSNVTRGRSILASVKSASHQPRPDTR